MTAAFLTPITIVKCFLGVIASLCGIMGVLDTDARVAEYHYVKAHWNLLGTYPSIRKLKTSWCGRGVAIALFGDIARNHYKAEGYRWWHILPDGFPEVIFHRTFWKNVLCGRFPK